jgi:hypothetical protein
VATNILVTRFDFVDSGSRSICLSFGTVSIVRADVSMYRQRKIFRAIHLGGNNEKGGAGAPPLSGADLTAC